MNLILFDKAELGQPLLLTDPRAIHMREILHIASGDTFKIGLIDGPRGLATISQITDDAIHWHFTLEDHIPSLFPITLIVGLARPPSARRIMREATTLGVTNIFFVHTETGMKSYAQSPVFQPQAIRALLIEGAQQAFCTRLPTVKIYRHIKAAVASTSDGDHKLALDNVRPTDSLTGVCSLFNQQHKSYGVTVAIGSERGWSDNERNDLLSMNFSLVSMGQRVLRTETACTSALAIILAAMGVM